MAAMNSLWQFLIVEWRKRGGRGQLRLSVVTNKWLLTRTSRQVALGSVGIHESLNPKAAESLAAGELFKVADDALYRAKVWPERHKCWS